MVACLALACQSKTKEDEPKPTLSVKGPVWEDGQRYVYGLELSSRLGMGAGQMIDLRLTSDVVLDARKRSEDTVQLAYVLHQAVFEGQEPTARAQFAALSEELARPFAFSLAGGRLSEVRIPQGWSQFAASIARTVASAFQFSEPPPQHHGDVWTADEFDATGGYQAEYRPMTGPLGFAKRKVLYRDVAAAGLPIGPLSAKLTPKVVSSTGSVTLTLDPSASAAGIDPGRIQLNRVEHKEKLETELTAGSLVSSETQLKLAFKRMEKPNPTFDWQVGLAKTRRLSASERYVTPKSSANYDKERIGDYTFERALQELERSDQATEPEQIVAGSNDQRVDAETLERRKSHLSQESRVFSAMTALLRVDAKHVGAAERRIRDGSPATRALCDALASAGTVDAQAALVRVMDDAKVPNRARLAASFSLGRTEVASPESVSALSKYVGPGLMQVHALYGLGTIARRLREAGMGERSASIVTSLVDALGAAKTPAARVHALRGLANSGGASALPSVKPYLKDDSPKVRAAAIDAVRLMDDPDVDPIIALALKDRDPLVQSSALDAIAVRSPSDVLAQALTEAAKSAEKPELRLKAVRVLEQWLPKRPALRAPLEHLATNDSHERIRSAAKSALAP